MHTGDRQADINAADLQNNFLYHKKMEQKLKRFPYSNTKA